jgi:hypothetical protein
VVVATAREPLEDASAEAAEERIRQRLAELEQAEAEGRLFDLVKDTPSLRDQLQPFLEEPDLP